MRAVVGPGKAFLSLTQRRKWCILLHNVMQCGVMAMAVALNLEKGEGREERKTSEHEQKGPTNFHPCLGVRVHSLSLLLPVGRHDLISERKAGVAFTWARQ